MATLVLQVAGAALGGVIGGPIGALAGRAIGALAGAAIDQRLFASGGGASRTVEGPRLTDLDGLAASEGAPVPRVYGRARVGGQLIWATRFEEVVTTEVTRSRASGGKGGGGSRGTTTTTTTYSYFANIAIGLCEGEIALVRRVWADGQELDLTTIAYRVHRGSEDQMPDPLIVAKEGASEAPAYRGLAYIVFERLPLAPYGNRLPQLSFEVIRPLAGLARMVRHVCLIPGSSEFGYDPVHVVQALGEGSSRSDNRHQLTAPSDMLASLDALQAICPSLARVSLVVSWFGTDLRAGACRIEPRVEIPDKALENGAAWDVGGLTRAGATPVSQVNGRPAYGGTPSDASVIRLIRLLKARGLEVVLYPFVLMDIPAGNGRADPDGRPEQPPYPWRGRITCSPAPGRPGSPDGTAIIATDVAAFFGTALPGHFAASGDAILYGGPDEWTFRRHILHYATLAAAAGGVSGFVIGSELVGLTRLRAASGVYPATAQLAALASDVRAILGSGTAITYAADWTEYGAHVLDGGAQVRFPLDPLWANPAIDAVGVDFYPPLADWRDEAGHVNASLARSAYDHDYLARGLTSGEAFDWFYATDADRLAQLRTPITDGLAGKPWIFRAKDLAGWWLNPHYERVANAELPSPTAWQPGLKPIWLTELGVPAVDKGANGPNVFPDPKSSEDRIPPLSGGQRDDLIQRRTLEAVIAALDPATPRFVPAANPISPLDGRRMIAPRTVAIWAWDARPFPAFPNLASVWADAGNWDRGHWITGRIEGGGLDDVIAAILADYGGPLPESLAVDGFLDGYVIERPMSARAALEPLLALFGVEAVAAGGRLAFAGRSARPVATLTADDLVPDRNGDLIRFTRAQETDLPKELRVGFTDGESEYRRASARSRRIEADARRELQADTAIVTRRGEAQRLADIWLQDLWVARERAEFRLSSRWLALDVGDIVALPAGSGARLLRIDRITDGAERTISARAIEPSVYALPAPDLPRRAVATPRQPGPPLLIAMDLPVVTADPPVLQWLATRADPWPGRLAIWRAVDDEAFEPAGFVEAPSVLGRTLTTLPPGPLWRFDRATMLDVRLEGGFPSSIGEAAALEGRNLFAIRGEGSDADWEIIAAAHAELVGEKTWRLSRLLRGLGGSEPCAARTLGAGARIVAIDRALTPLATGTADLGRTLRHRLGPAGRDHADPAFRTLEAPVSGIALRPLAPVHAKARRTPEGVQVTWIRRTRTDGDNWDLGEVPLGETSERYRVVIGGSGGPLREVLVSEPAWLYPAAAEIADFGAPQAALAVAIAQESASVGWGTPLTRLVPIR